MTCTQLNGLQCVCNLVAVTGESSPTSFGLRVDLGHFYGIRALPPCVRGTLGMAYGSTHQKSSAAERGGRLRCTGTLKFAQSS